MKKIFKEKKILTGHSKFISCIIGMLALLILAYASIGTKNVSAKTSINQAYTYEKFSMATVNASKYSLNKSKITLVKGTSYTLKINNSQKKASWKSKNKKVATVSTKGLVKAKKKGTTTISVKYKGKTLKCKVTVVDPKLSKTKVTLTKGKTTKLKITGTSLKVTWKSSNKKVATVSSKGNVKAIGSGTATITAKVGTKKLTCKVTVKNPTTNKKPAVAIKKTSIKIERDKTYTLSMVNTTATPTWSSKDKKIAKVSSKGVVTGVCEGTTTITATIGKNTYSCTVTVKPNTEYRRIEKYIIDSINEKRVELGLKPLQYMTSGIMQEYTMLHTHGRNKETETLLHNKNIATTDLMSMYLLGIKETFNRNRIIRQHDDFYEEEYKYIAAYTMKDNNDYNLIYFTLFF